MRFHSLRDPAQVVSSISALTFFVFSYDVEHACLDQEVGDRGSGPPPEKSQNIGFLSNTGLDPLKNHKASKPDSM